MNCIVIIEGRDYLFCMSGGRTSHYHLKYCFLCFIDYTYIYVELEYESL